VENENGERREGGQEETETAEGNVIDAWHLCSKSTCWRRIETAEGNVIDARHLCSKYTS
jgi:hypothetical protein